MMPKPIGFPVVQEAMERYRKYFGKEFPIDWIDKDYPSPEIAVQHIESFISSGEPVQAEDLIDTEKVFGKKIDLSEYL